MQKGVGSAILDRAEELAARRCSMVCLGVGLHSGYGIAQWIDIQRGVHWYQDRRLPEGQSAAAMTILRCIYPKTWLTAWKKNSIIKISYGEDVFGCPFIIH